MKNKYHPTDKCDIDYREFSRAMYGRLTPRRVGVVMDYVSRFNSEAGGSFRCHHDHDCCGCLTGASMSFEVRHGIGDCYHLEIIKQFNYNY